LATDISGLESALNYRFKEPRLLRQALTHRSYGLPHNERLEFLGDSVLNAVTARLLFDTYANRSEGELSRLRSSLVKKETLAVIAVRLQLGAYLWLGEGELRSGGEQRPSMLADALEAVFAAIYLDSSFEKAGEVISGLLMPLITDLDPGNQGKDNKTLLQEWLQAKRHELPKYIIVAQRGEAHDQHFVVACELAALGITTQGEGMSRRAAEQEAAAQALARLPTGRTRKALNE